MVCILTAYGKELLYAVNACDTHVLGNLHCVGAPRRYHLATWTDEKTVHRFTVNNLCFAEEPT